MSRLDLALATYLQSWGPLQWRDDCQGPIERSRPSYLGSTFDALGTIETDSRVQFRKIILANLDSDPRIREFVYPWLAEEAEHGRALRELARLYGGNCAIHERTDRVPSVKNLLAWPALLAARPAWRSLQAAYCVQGMMQEHLALTVYRYLGEVIAGQPGSQTLKNMARQEGRHMRFYREASYEFLTSPTARLLSHNLVVRAWRPVGIDALGVSSWWEAIGPLLADPAFRNTLVKLDAIVQALPAFGGTTMMHDFLRNNSKRIEYYARIAQEKWWPSRSDPHIKLGRPSTS